METLVMKKSIFINNTLKHTNSLNKLNKLSTAKKLLCGLAFIALTSITPSHAVENYLSTANPLSFDNQSYVLTFSQHPTDNYYKQEYLPRGQSLNSYTSMLTIDYLEGTDNVESAIGQKIRQLDAIKQSNPFVNYDVMKKNDSYILDFILSKNGSDGRFEIVERNVYRYENYNNGDTKGVLLLAATERVYGDDTYNYVSNLKVSRGKLLLAMDQFAVPNVSPK